MTIGFGIVELVSIIMFFFSYYAIIVSRNMIKSIIFMSIMEVSVVMFWLSIGFNGNIVPPILQSMEGHSIENIGDPLTQGLMITAIVIGLSVTAVNTIMFLTLYRKYKTTDWDIVKKRQMAG
ncbi:MAG: sodium:proton antiporter [Defluviitaleaceae bacterium]|nr:sodium:proton antiporter [Defluviitaleaceae bacterium]